MSIRRNFTTTAFKLAGITIAAAALSAQANAQIGQVCLELPAGASVVKAEIASGCIGSGRNFAADFEIKVTGDNARIEINGGFRDESTFPIGTADCMGSRVIEQEAAAAGPRRYSVFIGGTYRGVIDASDDLFGMRATRHCFAGAGQRQLPQLARETTYDKRIFNDWVRSDREGGDAAAFERSYTSLSELAAALSSGHPENLEGRPSVSISLSRARWKANSPLARAANRFMAIRIEEHGYADDSISGKRTFAAARHDEQTGNWQLTDQWHQFMCARGSKAGQWTGQRCE